MRTIGGVLLNSITFLGVWLLVSSISIFIASGWGDSGVGEYLRLGTSWFICPCIGGYFAPKITTYFIHDLDVDYVIASFITIISIIFVLFMIVSIFVYSSQFGGTISQMVQLTFQFLSILIGTLLGKLVVKSNR
ncbi:hypothetical protein ACXJY6_12865 [Vibrio sp. RC27]